MLLRQLAELRAQEYRLLGTQVQRKAQMRRKLRGHMPAVNVANIEDLRRILIESQSRMEYVAQHSFIPVYKVNREGFIIFANGAASQLLGYSREEMQSGTFSESQIVPRDRQAREREALASLDGNLGTNIWETERLTALGRRVPVAVTLRIVNVESGERLVYLLDLSDLRQLEEELKQRQTIFSALVEEMPHIVFVVSADGCMGQFNRRFYELTGTSPLIDDGFLWRRFISEEDIGAFEQALAEAAIKGSALEGEYRIVSKDGESYWHIVRALPLKSPVPGQVEGLLEITLENNAPLESWTGNKALWIGTATDIDRRKQLMEDVLESAHAFQSLADQIPQIVWTAGPDGRIDFFSQRWFQFSGLSRQYKVGLDFALFMHPDDRREYIRRWKSCVKSGDAFEAELRLKGRRTLAAVGDNHGAVSESAETAENDIKYDSEANQYERFLARAVALRNDRGDIVQWVGTWTSID
jgi:PAS domain S-box-containing protein